MNFKIIAVVAILQGVVRALPRLADLRIDYSITAKFDESMTTDGFTHRCKDEVVSGYHARTIGEFWEVSATPPVLPPVKRATPNPLFT